MASDSLLQHGDAGPVSCTDCGAPVPSGAHPPAHWCLEGAARSAQERARALLASVGPHRGPAMRAAVLYGAALSSAPPGERGDTVRAMMRDLRATASELAGLLGAGPHAGPPGWEASK